MLSKCGVDVRGETGKLNINYRTTERNREFQAVGLLRDFCGDDLDEGNDEQAGYLSLLTGRPAEYAQLQTKEEEAVFIVESIQQMVSEHRAEDMPSLSHRRRH